VGVHLGVWGFIPSHSPTLPGAWNLTPTIHSWPTPLQAFALVVNPRLRLWHLWWVLLKHFIQLHSLITLLGFFFHFCKFHPSLNIFLPLCSKNENNPIINEKIDAHVLKMGFFMSVAKTCQSNKKWKRFKKISCHYT